MSTAAPSGAITFREFEHGRWESCVSAYDRYFGPLTSSAIEPLLAALGAGPGVRLLDVATGPGYVASAASQLGCRVDAIDFSAEMIAAARQRTGGAIAFESGDAENLAYAAGVFDAVAMNFGVLHLSQPERAFAEARRVLRTGGVFGFTAWCPPEEAHGFALILRAIQTAGDPEVSIPAGPPFFRFSDPLECRRALLEAGFQQIDTQVLPLTWTVPSAEVLYEAFYDGTARTGGLLRAQPAAASEAIRRMLIEDSAPYRGTDGSIRIPMPALLVMGR